MFCCGKFEELDVRYSRTGTVCDAYLAFLTDVMNIFPIHWFYAGDAVFAAHIAEVLDRVSELKDQLQSFSRHQQVRVLLCVFIIMLYKVYGVFCAV